MSGDHLNQTVTLDSLNPLYLEHFFTITSFDFAPPDKLIQVFTPFLILPVSLELSQALQMLPNFSFFLDIGKHFFPWSRCTSFVLSSRIVPKFTSLPFNFNLFLFQLIHTFEELFNFIWIVQKRCYFLILKFCHLSRVLRWWGAYLFPFRYIQ